MSGALYTSEFRSVRFILLDIEGTTSDIDFVKNVLFPYSARELRNFIATHKHNHDVREALALVGKGSDEESIQQLLRWIKDDVKHPALKTLQGLIWRKGFESGEFTAHVYDDVAETLSRWRAAGLKLGIYSSGSVAAQKLYFTYTCAGNLLHHFVAHFDLSTGGKREKNSYELIARSLELSPDQILFLSDVAEELDAAKLAGLKTAQIVRPGTTPSAYHFNFKNLSEV